MAKLFKDPLNHDLLREINDTFYNLDDILDVKNFENCVQDIYPKGLKLTKSNK